MTDETDRLGKAQRGVIDAVKELFWAWREADQAGGADKFIDSTFDPCLDTAFKELGI